MMIHQIWLNFFHKIIMLPFLKIVIGGEFSVSDSLKKKTQFIIVANHTSHADTAAILSSIPLGNVHNVFPVAARDYFAKNKVVGFLFRFFMNLLLIDRYKRDGSDCAIESMVDALDTGKSLIIFPEGSRITDDELGQFKKGVVHVLKQRPEIPFIPVFIKSSAHVMPKGDPLVIPHNFKLVSGDAHFIDLEKSDNENIEIIRNKVLILQKSIS